MSIGNKTFSLRVVFGYLSLILLIAEFLATLNFPYTCSGLRIRSSSDVFVVDFVSRHGPAADCGFSVGDAFYSMKGITREFRSTLTTVDDIEKLYSSIYAFDTPIEYVSEDGEVKTLYIPSDMSFWTRLQCLEKDDIVLYVTAFLFIIFSLFCRHYLDYMRDAGSFLTLLYCIGLVLVNGFTNTANPYWFSVANEIIYQICAAMIAVSCIDCVCFFFKFSTVKDSVIKVQRFAACLPLCFLLFRLAIIPIDPASVFDSVFTTMTKGLMFAGLLWLIGAFMWLLRHIPRQSSSMLRCCLTALSFSVLPLLSLQFQNLFSSSYWIAKNEIPMEVLPLLFIPVAISFAFIQTKSYRFDRIASSGMVFGCAWISGELLLILLSALNVPAEKSVWIIMFCVPLIYILLNRPVTEFLFPQVENLEAILSRLENEVYLSSDIREICRKTTTWLKDILSPSYVYFYALGNSADDYRLIHCSDGETPSPNSQLDSMIEERQRVADKARDIVKHGFGGLSVPLFRGNELFGYLFMGEKKVAAGSRAQEFFSTAEIKLTRTVARIVMEAAMMSDIMRNQKQSQELKESNDKLAHDVAVKNQQIMRIQDMTVLGMAAMVESRDNSTGGHIRRTSAAVSVFAEKLMEVSEFDRDADWLLKVVRAAPLHDLGKIAVDDRVLRKAGPFTPEEYEEMKKHSEEGARVVNMILENVEDPEFRDIAVNIAHYHHEKWDGSGYPEGISGSRIPLEARIMAFADVFDALVSKRCYKDAFSFEKAYSIIENELGSHFDPVLGKTFLECIPLMQALYSIPSVN